uniref:Uncharacterized protein n=1 Tax=Fagus sylvatica TaxID=28930 RepID=A0A2N9GGP3_FAGSY
MGDFLGLFSLVSSSSSLSSSLATAGAAADRFSVTEFAVDRWTTRRGPLGGVEDQLSSTFSGLWLMLRWIIFFWIFTMSDGMAAILIHVLLRLSFYLWLKLFPSRESAAAHLPRLPCRKVLATVIGIRREKEKTVKKPPSTADFPLLPMASSSSHPPPDTAMASGGIYSYGRHWTIVAGSVDDESVDGSRFSLVPEDDREDFVFPLLDPWYDNGDNFLYVPSKVSLPPSNWEWMLRGQEATADQVWVPPLSSISDLKI